MKLNRFLATLLFTGLSLAGFAQLDTRHWVPPFYAKPGAGTGNSNLRTHFVSLSTPAVETIPITIRNGFGELIDIVEISRDNPVEYVLGIGNSENFPLNVIPTDSLNIPIRSQGLTFTSFQPFYVNMRHKSATQGTSLTTKGQVAKGKRFYSGHLFTIYNTTTNADLWNNQRRAHFISVMATEDNTTVTFDMIKLPIALIGYAPGEPVTVTLNALESFTVGIDHSLYNDATINNANGIRITSNKDVVCNTGSWLSGNQSGQDIGTDQLVPAENVGQEYILVRGLGDQTTERPIVVATADNTQVFLNDEATPAATINEGEFYIVPTNKFSANGNLYILATEKVYVYQTLSGSSTNVGPTVGLNFIPPLNCIGAKEVNIAFVNSLAAGDGQGRINIITKLGAQVFLNGDTNPLTGAQSVTGINDWVTYAFDPTTDNVQLESDSVMNVALLTRDNFVGTAGYFSGFTLEPVVGLSAATAGSLPCVPGNAVMQVFGFDSYQWYFNGEAIEGATGNSLIPTFAGSYTVEGIDEACGFRFMSNEFELPLCPSTIGVAKSAINVQETTAGSKIFDVTYRLVITNYAPGIATNVQITENIATGLPTGATAVLLQMPVLSQGIITGGFNAAFNGTTIQGMLSGNGSMTAGATAFIDYVVRIDMNNAEQDGYMNQVIVTTKESGINNGLTGPFNGQDFSHAGTNPDPNGNGDPNEDAENDPTLVCFFSQDISYVQSAFCATDAVQEVSVDGINPGIFTSTPGLALDPETGAIDVSQSAPGTYTVTFSSTGRCPATRTTEVTIVAAPVAGIPGPTQVICADGAPLDLSNLVSGGSAPGTWTDAQGNPLGNSFASTTAGTFTLTYSVEAPPCAAATATLSVNAVAEPNPGIATQNNTTCLNSGPVDLTDFLTNADPDGQWFNLAGDVISPEVTHPAPGQYFYTYQVSNSVCGVRTVTISVQVLPVPNPGVSLGETAICANESVDLNTLLTEAAPNGTWTDADGTPVAESFTPSQPGTYTFTYTVGSPPCTPQSNTVTVVVENAPNPGTAESPYTVCQGDNGFSLFSILTNASPGGTWTDGSGNVVNNIFIPAQVGNFTRTYTLFAPGCEPASVTFVVSVTDVGCEQGPLVIPQGFSPNGDGIGDLWVIKNLFLYPNNTVKIFNRWGNEVYAARPYTNNWNGTAQTGVNAGAQLPEGTYWYILDLGDGSEPRRGYVYLTR